MKRRKLLGGLGVTALAGCLGGDTGSDTPESGQVDSPSQFRDVSLPVDYIRMDGSRFRLADGVAVDGPHEGTQLQRATELSPMFWFAWADFHSRTDIWQP